MYRETHDYHTKLIYKLDFMKKKLSVLALVGATLLGCLSCQKQDIYEEFEKPTDVVNPNPPLPPVDFTKASLGELAAKQGFLLGTAFTHSEYFQNDSVPKILKKEFTSVTIGNEMKHDAIVSASGKLKFDTADEMALWAAEADTKLYGHVLGWHQQQNVTYLQGLVDKAAADNTASVFQSNWNFEAGSLESYTASGFEATNAYIDVFAGDWAAKAIADDATLAFTAGIEADKAYSISFWAKAGSEGGSISLLSGDKQSAKTAVDAGWAKYSVALKTKSVGADYSYQLTASNGVCIDNIRVTETVIEEESAGGNYINPKAIDGGIDFESYAAETPGADLVSTYGWSQCNGAASVSVSAEKANSGKLSLKMDNSDDHCSNGWDIQVITPKYAVEAGKTYRIAWYGMANVEADLQIDIREDGATKDYKNSKWGQYDKFGPSWAYFYIDYTVEAGSELSIGFYGGTAAACYYIDDFQIFEAIYDGDYTNYIDKTNLLVGGDFETEGAYGIWNGSDYASVVSRNEPEIGSNKDAVHSALHALVVDNTTTGYTGGDAWHIQVAFNNKIEVTGAQSYRFGFWAKSPDGADTIQAELKWDDGTTNYKQISGITDKWSFLYLDAVAPDAATEVQIVFDCAYAAGTYHVDDVQFYPTPVESCIEASSVVDDGDFEAYADAAAMVTAGWQVNGPDYVTIVSDTHHGKAAVRMDNSDDHCSNAWDIQLVSKKYTVEAGKTYRIAWQGKADAADVDLQIDIRGGAETEWKSSAYGNYDKLGTDWTAQSYDYTTAEDQTEIQVGFYGGGSANVITIDCFQIYPVEASAAAKKAAMGYGKYFAWTRPAARVVRPMAAEFESTTKLDGELAEDALGYAYKSWVYQMVEHFDVYGWDVMNEVLTEDGSFRNATNTTGDNIFIWGTYFGGSKNFTDKAFAYATDALKLYGKTADLYINDYNIETSAAKRAALCEYAKNNAQVTGVGTQMHLDMATEGLEEKIAASLTELAATGKKVRISELDIKCTDLDAQASLYKYIFEKYIELVPEAQRGGITIWGINDKDSWVGEDNQPLLWSGNKYNKKAAYESIYVYLCELAGIDPYQEEEE